MNCFSEHSVHARFRQQLLTSPHQLGQREEAKMNPTIRTLVTSLMIAAVAPIGLAALDLEQAAFAKNGNGGGNGGGHGGNGGGNGKSGEAHGKSSEAKAEAKAAKAEAKAADESEEGEGMRPNELGKLNGILNANPNAIAHASANSPKGIAREFGEALAGLLDSAEAPAGGEAPAEGEETVDDETPTIDELGEMMARMTNKPVTADQVQAVAEKVGIATTDEAPTDEGTADEGTTDEDQAAEDTTDDPTVGDEPPALDQATAQEIADKANEIHGFDTGDDTTDGDDTADAGDDTDDTGDETVTN
jgi:hypothetical protein